MTTNRYFEANDVNDLYVKLIRDVVETPEYVTTPRGLKIKEKIGVIAKLTDPLQCLITLEKRKMSYAFAAIEKLEYLSGQTDADRLIFYNRNFANFRNDNRYFDGAYAERLQYWFKHLLAILSNDRDSRQAVATIYGPQDRHASKDIPCTVMFQFIIRENKLNMIAYMRSNDLLWGFPYDTNGFCFIQEALASLLGVELGTYELHAGSLHSYTEREGQLTRLLQQDSHATIEPRNPVMESYKGQSYNDLLIDLNMFWVAEHTYRTQGHHSNIVDELPIWLLEYYSIIVEHIEGKTNEYRPID